MRFITDLEAIGQQDSIRRYTQAALVVNFKGQRLTTNTLVVTIECDDLNSMWSVLDALKQGRVFRIRRECLRIPENGNTGFVIGKYIGGDGLCLAALLKDRGWHTKTSTEFAIYG